MRSTISTDLSIYKVYMILDASILRKCEQFSYTYKCISTIFLMHIRCSLADAYNKYIIYIRTILMSSLDKQKKNHS